MEKKIPFGITDFKEIIEGNYYYVDKTKAIEELVDTGTYVPLFTRPRKFGKTVFLSMLDNFFNIEKKEVNKNLFDGLYISKSEYFKCFGKYPVIKLDFKNINGPTYKKAYKKYKEVIKELYKSKEYVKECLCYAEKIMYNEIMKGTADRVKYEFSIEYLTNWLKRYYNEYVVVLIDEYDIPLRAGYKYGYYEKIRYLIVGALSAALKDSDSLKMGIMVGTFNVIRYMSDLNNYVEETMLDNHFKDILGFSESETKEMLKYYGIEINKDVKGYYGAYNSNGVIIYNPWDIINYIKNRKLKSYWFNYAGVKKLFKNMDKRDVNDIQKAIQGEKVIALEMFGISTHRCFEAYMNEYYVYYLLFVSGYLTLDRIKDRNYIFRVTNRAIKEELIKLINKM